MQVFYPGLLRTTLTASLMWAVVGTVIGWLFENAFATEIEDINIYPWSSIGKIGTASAHTCSAAVIGSNEFVTAAHCLFDDATKRFFPGSSIHFLLGYARGEYRAHRVASRYAISPVFDPSLYSYPPDRRKLLIGARYDWALGYVDEPFPDDVKPLRLATATPSLGTAVMIAGYAIERPHLITADLNCQVSEISSDKKLIAHDCVTHQGDSGGPVLSKGDEGMILGINVLVPNPIRLDYREQSKKWGAAVSAASISEFLASHTH